VEYLHRQPLSLENLELFYIYFTVQDVEPLYDAQTSPSGNARGRHRGQLASLSHIANSSLRWKRRLCLGRPGSGPRGAEPAQRKGASSNTSRQTTCNIIIATRRRKPVRSVCTCSRRGLWLRMSVESIILADYTRNTVLTLVRRHH